MKTIATVTLSLALLIGLALPNGAQAEPTLAELEARIAELEQAAQPTGSRIPLQAAWQNGLRLDSADGAVQLKISGRVQTDYAALSGDQAVVDQVGSLDDGSLFRRARLRVSGTLYTHGIFMAEYDFAGGDADFADVWVGLQKLPWIGRVRVGHMLEPYGLESLSGNNYHHFIERGLSAAFFPYRNNGITINNTWLDGMGTWAIGAYQSVPNNANFTTNSKYAATARVTLNPIYADGGARWLHLGVAYSYRKPDAESVRYSSRPESFVAPVFINTGAMPADRVDLIGGELAAVHGPLSLQAEYQMAGIHTLDQDRFTGVGDVDLDGYYVTVGYFVTGEHRTYSRGSGVFSRVIPKRNFDPANGGWGAWEVAARYSTLNLNDGPVEGGELTDWTLGVNWHINPNIRVMANYVRADLEDVGESDLALARFQFDF
jgi:phosphate-selective porin OprO and OprP